MVKVCEILGYIITEGGVYMYKFSKHNVKQENAWISWINQPGWIPKSNNRVCELHFVPEDYMYIRQDAIQKLKPFAIPLLQVEERKNIEKLCGKKTIQRFQSSQYMKDVTNIHSIDDKKSTDNYIYKDHTYNLKALINNKAATILKEIKKL